MDREPPRCPGCGEVLLRVYADGRTTWVYHWGHYHAQVKDKVALSCPKCGASLGDEFCMGIFYWGCYEDA